MAPTPRLDRREFLALGVGAAALLALPPCREAEAAKTVFGPMLGHVTPTSARLWAYAGGRGAISVRWWKDGDAPESGSRMPVFSDPDRHWAAKASIEGLEPATTYRYGLLLDGRPHPRWEGTLTTAPAAGEPTKFRMAFCSCMRPEKGGKGIWDRYLEWEPAFHLMLGDNVYADTTDAERLWAAHLEMRAVPQFARVLRHLPSYAMWDDHDFGGDNADGSLVRKEDSLRAFREVWANPGSGLPNVPGTFYRFSWGDVDFFVLDGRYHRTPDRATNDGRKRMLGDAQFAWLAEGLKTSRARFKVLASGSVLRDNEKDGWHAFDFERRRLYGLVAAHRIPGVLYLSGDIHRCKIVTHAAATTGFYDLYEVISSGVMNGDDRGFVTIDFDTTIPDPSALVRIHRGDGTVKSSEAFVLSALQT
jgi:alkaline phosphatase D